MHPIKSCLFTGNTESLNTSYKFEVDGESVEVWVSDVVADDITKKMAMDKYSEVRHKMLELESLANRLGYKIVPISDVSAQTATQQASVAKENVVHDGQTGSSEMSSNSGNQSVDANQLDSAALKRLSPGLLNSPGAQIQRVSKPALKVGDTKRMTASEFQQKAPRYNVTGDLPGGAAPYSQKNVDAVVDIAEIPGMSGVLVHIPVHISDEIAESTIEILDPSEQERAKRTIQGG